MHKSFLRLFTICVLIIAVYYLFWDRDVVIDATIGTEYTAEPEQPPENPNVLLYGATTFFGDPMTNERFLRECNEYKQGWCHLTSNPNDFPNASAVLFHQPNFDYLHFPTILDKDRNPDIPYILWALESPSNTLFYSKKDYFNLTMYYRRDADIWYPYGHMKKLKQKAEVDYERIWAHKSANKSAVWIGSNCQTANKRSELMQALRMSGLKIEIYGACGKPAPKDCVGVGKQNDDCVTEIVKEFKFYMAIENSFCEDYVTEKFFYTLAKREAIPIVGKRSLYQNLKIPDSAYIAIDDYKSLKFMVQHLKFIGSKKDTYLQYFKWKENYRVVPEVNDETGFCALCKKLIAGTLPRKSYADIHAWHSRPPCENNYLSKYYNLTSVGALVVH
ncbi:unnamed protein product, partial [Mesorhabditis spiculigera]